MDPAVGEATAALVERLDGAADTIGVCSVAIRPGLPETEQEHQSAFGTGLTWLRTLRDKVDPTGVLAGNPV